MIELLLLMYDFLFLSFKSFDLFYFIKMKRSSFIENTKEFMYIHRIIRFSKFNFVSTAC